MPLQRPKESVLFSPNSSRKHFVSSSTVCYSVVINWVMAKFCAGLSASKQASMSDSVV